MKLRKRIFCFILCVSILVVSVVPSFALTVENNENYSFLLAQGFSDSFLKNQTDDYLQRMVDIVGENEVGNIETTVTELHDGDIATMGTINSSSLTLEIVAAEICKKGSTKIETVLVSASWEWAANKPVYRGKDAITINWNHNVFTYADGFYGQDVYKSNAGDDWTIFKEYDTLAQSNQGGIGHWTDLKAFKKYVGGGMLFILNPTSPINKGSKYATSINAQYAHAAVPLNGLSISIVGYGVGLNWNYSCDTLSATHVFRYSK